VKRTKKLRRVGFIAGLLTTAMVLAGCGSDDGDNGDTAGEGGNGSGGTITMGYLPSWTDGLATAYLMKNILEDEGYTVEMTELTEAAPLYQGLADGDIDIYPSAWSEATHSDYWAEHGDQIEDLATYYGGAKLTMAVPEYMDDVNSIADLKGQGDRFDGRIVGIEPGAGLTRVTKNDIMPAYGLDGEFTLLESSTTAMLAELQNAVENEEDIVVTLWRPFWANASFPVKDLEDPEGAFPDPEGLHVLARDGFSDDFGEVADMLGNFEMTDEQFGTLEDLVVNEFGEGQEEEAVAKWLEDNPDFVDSLKG
jgi:glycine betaine/proline transport system substrate-binding protein